MHAAKAQRLATQLKEGKESAPEQAGSRPGAAMTVLIGAIYWPCPLTKNAIAIRQHTKKPHSPAMAATMIMINQAIIITPATLESTGAVPPS